MAKKAKAKQVEETKQITDMTSEEIGLEVGKQYNLLNQIQMNISALSAELEKRSNLNTED